jgi:hypothetical protein
LNDFISFINPFRILLCPTEIFLHLDNLDHQSQYGYISYSYSAFGNYSAKI